MTLFRQATLRLPTIVLAGVLVGCGVPAKPVTPVRGDVLRDPALARAETGRAFGLIRDGKYAQAQPVLTRAVEADPDYGPAHNDLGLVHYHLGRLYDAAWEFETAAKLMPQSPEPRNNLGLVLEDAGKLAEAETSYSEARRLGPENVEYVGNLARIRVRRDERDAQTRSLLEKLVLSDTRPDWVEWARRNLALFRPNPVTVPADNP